MYIQYIAQDVPPLPAKKTPYFKLYKDSVAADEI
jgi:hypothetical protein